VHRAAGVESPADVLAQRSQAFAVRIIRFVRSMPRDIPSDAIARQLARSGPGISANYRSARRARSRAEFIARLGIVVEEADEHWLCLIRDDQVASGPEMGWLLQESIQLRAIFSKSLTTARLNYRQNLRSKDKNLRSKDLRIYDFAVLLRSSNSQILRSLDS
jgi:four helix bundle protein